MSDYEDGNDGAVDSTECKPARMDYKPPELSTNVEELFEDVFIPSDDFLERNQEIEVVGENVPKSIMTFEEADLEERLLLNVARHKYLKPTQIQSIAIPTILNKRDFIACAETGSGKTAGFLLPIIDLMLKEEHFEHESYGRAVCSPTVLIMSPTRELASQIYSEGHKFCFNTNIKVAVVYGGTDVGCQLDRMGGAHILSGTVGRVNDFIKHGKICLSHLKYFVLDEADRMLDMGFKEEVRKIYYDIVDKVKENGEIQKPQCLMFSATFPKQIHDLAEEFLENHIFITVGSCLSGGANKDILQKIIKVDSVQEKQDIVCDILMQSQLKTLVFVETKFACNLIAGKLISSNVKATNISGDRMQKEREIALSDFKNNRKQVLVATSVAARGLDIPGVEQVINFDLPKMAEEYIHRIGRTGRLGHKGLAISLYFPSRDGNIREALCYILKESGQVVPDFLSSPDTGSLGFTSRRSRQQGGTNDFGGSSSKSNGNSNIANGVCNNDDDDDWENDEPQIKASTAEPSSAPESKSCRNQAAAASNYQVSQVLANEDDDCWD